MKTIGVIGGMSWESSTEYYRLLSRHAKARRGGHHNGGVPLKRSSPFVANASAR
ncbi:aspartate racemase domain protein [Paraburkholderia xenovorans LB400]|jgi:aspartate/glutamate racemase|nr:aspartate racemase domain protein [Paraburkholderia xenovorans LB400]